MNCSGGGVLLSPFYKVLVSSIDETLAAVTLGRRKVSIGWSFLCKSGVLLSPRLDVEARHLLLFSSAACIFMQLCIFFFHDGPMMDLQTGC